MKMIKKTILLVIGIALMSIYSCSSNDDDSPQTQECTNDNSTDQNNRSCTQSSTIGNSYSETVLNDTRTVTTNGIPTHDFAIQIQSVNELNSDTKTYRVDKTPSKSSLVTGITSGGMPQYAFGVASNGVKIDPAPALPFIFENTSTGEYNWDWVFEPTNNMQAVGLDCAIAHVQPDGAYHYHGDMALYADQLLAGLGTGTTVPTDPILLGWAGDGFPILYKYGPDESGAITKLLPSYQLKSGDRPGDGVSAPCDTYNGKYTNDYEYNQGIGELDECNGLDADVTINGETFSYFYVITEDFPVIPRCFVGAPSTDFRIGP